ncbi:class I SAM-dependent methyltransferase [Streptomyces sp. NBC_01615]|uniref:class I SAM-dependent methyltransferase n=1 Tax=Streptomyces sp. NBC_01615 TaxID=2975898 RepID=UPI00386B5C9E
MTAPPEREPRLSAADWDSWFTTGHPHVVSDKEAEHFHQLVEPRPGMTAVDLACGSGQWTRQLAAWGMTVTGYDFSTEALRQATAAGPRDGLTYAQWDIDAEPIPPDLKPGSLDVVTCRYALPDLQHARLLTDVGRWLRPDGTFYALVRLRPSRHDADAGQSGDAEPDTGFEPFHRGFTKAQVGTLASGWAHRETHQLSRRRRVIVLRGYGLTTPEPDNAPEKGFQSPGVGGDAPSPESCAPAPGPHGPGHSAHQDGPESADRGARACAIG